MEQPGSNGTLVTTTYIYGNIYQGPVTVTKTATPTHVYDSLGRRIRSGVTADDVTLVNASTTDVVNESDTLYELDGSNLWRVSRNYTYPKAGDAFNNFNLAKPLSSKFTPFANT